MLLELKQIEVPPGERVLLYDVSWSEFENILEELGEHRSSRIACDGEILEIAVPLLKYERDKEQISDFVKALLEEIEVDFWCLGSTTFKNSEAFQGIEPDNCFYIKNEALIRGKKRIDLTVDPPPDLALEIDVTSRTHTDIYQALGVPELWRFDRGKLQINVLQNNEYVEVGRSVIFPNFPLKEAIPQYLEKCEREGRNKTMKAFREWVREREKNGEK
ncbi:MAG: Uma2 family endonuclease [Cyanobacteriota bacterium]|nr:Uma2 family endonuclease [Cyanobacteriota bacterium]